jgi:thiamine-phosphate pyrophosphorylase
MKGLYIVTPDWDDTEALLRSTEAALRGGAVMVQYRHKTASPEQRKAQAQALLALCRRYQRPLIINDHVQLAIDLDADGIHVGGTDASVAQARAAVGAGKIVGASCYGDLELARKAHREGASHVAFGGFYPSRVKKYEVTTAHDIVSRSKTEIPLPVVVIGGMTIENSASLVAAGADMVAAISSVYTATEPEQAARGFTALWS